MYARERHVVLRGKYVAYNNTEDWLVRTIVVGLGLSHCRESTPVSSSSTLLITDILYCWMIYLCVWIFVG